MKLIVQNVCKFANLCRETLLRFTQIGAHSCLISRENLSRFTMFPVSFHVHIDTPCIHSSHITENARKASKTEMPAIAQSQKSW